MQFFKKWLEGVVIKEIEKEGFEVRKGISGEGYFLNKEGGENF